MLSTKKHLSSLLKTYLSVTPVEFEISKFNCCCFMFMWFKWPLHIILKPWFWDGNHTCHFLGFPSPINKYNIKFSQTISCIIGEAAENVEIVKAPVCFTLKIKMLCIWAQSLYSYLVHPTSTNGTARECKCIFKRWNVQSFVWNRQEGYEWILWSCKIGAIFCAREDGHGNLTGVGNNSREDKTECGKPMTTTDVAK